MISGPIVMRWEGDVMRPLGRFAAEADRRYVIGQAYAMDEIQERSSASHAHYFAVLKEAWQSLPETLTDRFPTPEHLRKFALVKAGFRDERTVLCGSRAEAQRVAAFIAPMDEFAVVSVSGTAVILLTPKSQSMRAMGKTDFEASKAKVLEVIADMLGVEPDRLSSAAGAPSRPARAPERAA